MRWWSARGCVGECHGVDSVVQHVGKGQRCDITDMMYTGALWEYARVIREHKRGYAGDLPLVVNER